LLKAPVMRAIILISEETSTCALTIKKTKKGNVKEPPPIDKIANIKAAINGVSRPTRIALQGDFIILPKIKPVANNAITVPTICIWISLKLVTRKYVKEISIKLPTTLLGP